MLYIEEYGVDLVNEKLPKYHLEDLLSQENFTGEGGPLARGSSPSPRPATVLVDGEEIRQQRVRIEAELSFPSLLSVTRN